MALGNYTQLQAALGSYSIRADQSANWPDFIAMAEARFSRLLSCRQMVATVTGNVTGATFTPPADFNGVKGLRLTNGSFYKLEPVSIDEMDELKGQPDVSGEPRNYAVTGLNIEVYPEPATATPYRLTYYQNIPALSSTPTNWLLTAYPDLYLYGSLAHFGVMAQDERLGAWEAAIERIVEEIGENDRASVYGDRLTPALNTSIA